MKDRMKCKKVGAIGIAMFLIMLWGLVGVNSVYAGSTVVVKSAPFHMNGGESAFSIHNGLSYEISAVLEIIHEDGSPLIDAVTIDILPGEIGTHVSLLPAVKNGIRPANIAVATIELRRSRDIEDVKTIISIFDSPENRTEGLYRELK